MTAEASGLRTIWSCGCMRGPGGGVNPCAESISKSSRRWLVAAESVCSVHRSEQLRRKHLKLQWVRLEGLYCSNLWLRSRKRLLPRMCADRNNRCVLRVVVLHTCRLKLVGGRSAAVPCVWLAAENRWCNEEVAPRTDVMYESLRCLL